MGKQQKKKNTGETIKVSKRIKADVNLYKGKAYCHLTDIIKDKTISLNRESIEKLLKALPKIIQQMENISDSSSSEDSD